MKLIIKEYLGLLQEREELDAILPDLLSQMGLNVYTKPMRGTPEFGVDIAAVGSINNGVESVYLFSVKEGNLTRATWFSSSLQSLKPSLEQILDAYIPSRIPPEHLNKPIVICPCFGGDVNTNVKQDLSGYEKRNTQGNISFENWNGDKLAGYIEEYLLNEELLSSPLQSLFRKSLALIDNPESSIKHFIILLNKILEHESIVEPKRLSQINVCLWILYSWGRDLGNIETAYLAAEKSILFAWEIAKKDQGKNNKNIKAYYSILNTYNKISSDYIENKILPYTNIKHGISVAIGLQSDVSVNLKLFDLLSRLAIYGLHLQNELLAIKPEENKNIIDKIKKCTSSIKEMIINNPLLLSPYKDDQAIDIFLALYLLSYDSEHDSFVAEWISHLINLSFISYTGNAKYPSNINKFYELLEHPASTDIKYKHKVTKASILYPTLAIFSALYKLDNLNDEILKFVNQHFQHCTMLYWYPKDDSEHHFYIKNKLHGAELTSIQLDKDKLLAQVFNECQNSNDFFNLSIIKQNLEPILLTACRSNRTPVPLHVLCDFYESSFINNKETTKQIKTDIQPLNSNTV
ncbi:MULTISPECIES: hypothetical protein [unclassified Pseudoalteromonas]|uniref:hypothetical protein n=1 Tax=unclassified Pseudoalteromonas TaxID=194690 RepID=UPI0005A87637|nr:MULTISPECIES: hypothetical protein [unclassified Pseudoalteromonas]